MEAKWTLKGWTTGIARAIEDQIQEIDGYPIEVKPGEGPRVFVCLKGAEGDTTAARAARAALTPIVEAAIHAESRLIDHRIESSNRGDDLLMTCLLLFP